MLIAPLKKKHHSLVFDHLVLLAIVVVSVQGTHVNHFLLILEQVGVVVGVSMEMVLSTHVTLNKNKQQQSSKLGHSLAYVTP